MESAGLSSSVLRVFLAFTAGQASSGTLFQQAAMVYRMDV